MFNTLTADAYIFTHLEKYMVSLIHLKNIDLESDVSICMYSKVLYKSADASNRMHS